MNVPIGSRTLQLILAFSVLCSSACSVIVGEPLSDDAKVRVAKVAQSYISSVVFGPEEKIADFIAWGEFLGKGRDKITHAEFSRQYARFKQSFTPQDPKNPLNGLRLADISGREDTATVEFEKVDGSLAEPVKVRFTWSGTGWIVIEDSLFGKNKLFGRLFPPPAANEKG